MNKIYALMLCLFTASLQAMQKTRVQTQSDLNESLFQILYQPVLTEDERGRQLLRILREGANINACEPSMREGKSTSNLTPLMIAAFQGMNTVVGILLEQGADRRLRSRYKLTAEEHATQYKQTNTASLIRNWSTTAGQSYTEKVTRDGSPVFEMIRGNEIASIVTWLKTATDLHVRDMEGNTLFQRAALSQNFEIMELLCTKRPAFLAEGNEYNGRTPLLTAITLGDVDIIEWIIDRDISRLNDRDRLNFASPLLIAATEAPRRCRYTIMALLIRNAPPDFFRTDINILLFFGLTIPDPDLVRFALALGADPYAPLAEIDNTYQAARGIRGHKPIQYISVDTPECIHGLINGEMHLRLDMCDEFAQKEHRMKLEENLSELQDLLLKTKRKSLMHLSHETRMSILAAIAILGAYLASEGIGLFGDSVKLKGKLLLTAVLCYGTFMVVRRLLKAQEDTRLMKEELNRVWGVAKEQTSKLSERLIGVLDGMTETTREMQIAMAAVTAATQTISGSLHNLINETRNVIVTLEGQIRHTSGDIRTAIFELRGNGREVAEAIQRGIAEGKFQPEAHIDIKAHFDIKNNFGPSLFLRPPHL